MGDLKNKAMRRDEKKKETAKVENNTINNLSKKPFRKDKAISARLNGTTYIKFKEICMARGLTSNACLNMLITDFVRENEEILEKIRIVEEKAAAGKNSEKSENEKIPETEEN